MALIDRVKLALRISAGNTTFDADEVQPIIDAAKEDLQIGGVKNIDDTDPLVQRAIILYAKGNFGYDDAADRYRVHYAALRDNMALSKKYGDAPEQSGDGDA